MEKISQDAGTAELLSQTLNSMEKDTVGEILNISMGTVATTISSLLGRPVSITTPIVTTENINKLEFSSLEPAIGIEIQYIEGLSGSNFMIMKRKDIRSIVNLLMSTEGTEDEELDEMQMSAISEIINQMMGSSSTSLAHFLGKDINISIPKQFDIESIKEKTGGTNRQKQVVCVRFVLRVEDLLDSEFITIMPLSFTRELVENALNFGDKATGPQTEDQGTHTPMPAKETNEEDTYSDKATFNASQVSVLPLQLKNFDEEAKEESQENQGNFNLIMGVPLDVSVEIGRTRLPVKNILDIRQGSIVELDRQAGDPVDVIVNGQLIARGDVVVIDDNLGVRITEILSGQDLVNGFTKHTNNR